MKKAASVTFSASCPKCGGLMTVRLGKKAAAATMLRALTVQHQKEHAACISGFLVLPMLSDLR